jgi:hypothetical protein
MKKLILLLLFPVIVQSQQLFPNGIKSSDILAFRGNALTVRDTAKFTISIDTAYTNAVSKITVTTPIAVTKYSKDYKLTFSPAAGTSYDSTRIAYTGKVNTFTADQTFAWMGVDSVLAGNVTTYSLNVPAYSSPLDFTSGGGSGEVITDFLNNAVTGIFEINADMVRTARITDWGYGGSARSWIDSATVAGHFRGHINVPVIGVNAYISVYFEDESPSPSVANITAISYGSLSGNHAISDTSAFTTTAARKAVYIAGATTTDKYFVSWRNVPGDETTVPTEIPFYYAKTDSLIVLRSAGTTNGLKFSFIRIR